MPTELEKDINEIKISVARIEEKLKVFDTHSAMFVDYELRLRAVENFKFKMIGWAGGIGAAGGLITALIIKLL